MKPRLWTKRHFNALPLVGDGEQAARQMRLMHQTDAALVIVARTLDGDLSELVRTGRVAQVTDLSSTVFDDAAIAFIGTGCPGLDAAAHDLARAAGCPVQPLGKYYRPDPVEIAESAIQDRDPFVEVMAKAARVAGPAAGCISLVGAGPGARNLLTLRAVQRLHDADIIFYDRLVDEDVLELTRSDAEKVFVGKHVGAHSWPQERINQVIVVAALNRKRVVRLKSGDPGIFGRATEEIAAARAAGVTVELVPGVTAASAAGAMLGRSLTERNVADMLVLATGTGSADDPLPEFTRLSGPGTTTAFYMSVSHADRLARDLMRKGLATEAPVDIAWQVSKAGEGHVATTLGRLAQTIRHEGIKGCAVLLVTWPKARSGAADLTSGLQAVTQLPQVYCRQKLA